MRVLVVDDDALVRAGLSMILSAAPDVAVVGEAADGAEVPGAVSQHEPDVVLMDIRMPRVDGLAATETLRARPGATSRTKLGRLAVHAQALPRRRSATMSCWS